MMKKLILLGVLCAGFALPPGVFAARSDLDDLQGLSVANAKIPINNKTRLQLVFFADGGERGEGGIIGRNAVMEALKSGRAVNKVWLAENNDAAFSGAEHGR